MNSLFNIFKKSREKYPEFARLLCEVEVVKNWEKTVGAGIAKHSRALEIKNSVLWVEVENTLWWSELHYQKNEILRLLNKIYPIVKDIFIVQSRRDSFP